MHVNDTRKIVYIYQKDNFRKCNESYNGNLYVLKNYYKNKGTLHWKILRMNNKKTTVIKYMGLRLSLTPRLSRCYAKTKMAPRARAIRCATPSREARGRRRQGGAVRPGQEQTAHHRPASLLTGRAGARWARCWLRACACCVVVWACAVVWAAED